MHQYYLSVRWELKNKEEEEKEEDFSSPSGSTPKTRGLNVSVPTRAN